ncbi:MAG: hypothetical protein HFJ41_02145 [Clostridia bacterium]|nr:hypothetical protein [Clostridia bacterium]
MLVIPDDTAFAIPVTVVVTDSAKFVHVSCGIAVITADTINAPMAVISIPAFPYNL